MPPGIETTWDENSTWAQAQLIGYNQVRDYENQEENNEMLKAGLGGHGK